jgi:putative intracellular protease/amidase
MIPTSGAVLKGVNTGLWLEEFAAPYYMFKEKGYDITIASSAGGPIPIDAGSMMDPFFTEPAKKLMHDADAIGAMMHSVKLETLEFPGDFDGMYLPGGHGACVDFVNNPVMKKAIETMFAADKVICTVCHGPICLIECVKPDGTPLVQGKKVTGFSDSEEAVVQKVDIVPYLIESKFKEQGAIYEKGDDWTSKVCVDGNLITGQNPQSSEAAGAAMIEALSS